MDKTDKVAREKGQYGDFFLRILLSNFNGARVIEQPDEVTDEMQEGLFIPLKENGLSVERGNIIPLYMHVTEHRASVKAMRKFGTHWVRQYIKQGPLKEYVTITLGRVTPTFLGNLYPVFKNNIRWKI